MGASNFVSHATTRTSRVALIAIFALPVVARAQAAGTTGSIEANANLLYGAARGRVASAGAALGKADSAWQLRGDAQWTYADARDAEDRRTVTARSSRLGAAIDARPFARVSPFVFGSAETSLQQRIALRTAGGAGAKYTFYRRKDDDVSLSLAILGERTRALHPDSVTPAITKLARWSLRGRVRHRFNDAVRITHVTFYQPVVDERERYTVDANTVLAVSVAKALALTTTWRERYDSEARRRGARSNHDGQFLFGVRATFGGG